MLPQLSSSSAEVVYPPIRCHKNRIIFFFFPFWELHLTGVDPKQYRVRTCFSWIERELDFELLAGTVDQTRVCCTDYCSQMLTGQMKDDH